MATAAESEVNLTLEYMCICVECYNTHVYITLKEKSYLLRKSRIID